MFEDVRTLQVKSEWSKEAGLAWLEFPISFGLFWLQYVPKGEKFAAVIDQAGSHYQAAVGKPGQFVHLDRIPAGVEELAELPNGLMLLQSDFVQARFVMVGRGGMEVFKDGYQKWEILA